jgi:hypothetical protein
MQTGQVDGSMTCTTTKLVEANVSLEKRRESARFFKNGEYPNSVPVFVQYKGVIHRYIVPIDNNFGHLLMAFRHKLSLKSTVGLISLVEKPPNMMGIVKSYQVSLSMTMGLLAIEYLHEDGFLYVNITPEHVFG